MKKLVSILLFCILALTGCAAVSAESDIQLSDYFTDRDLAGTWSDAETIDLTGQTAVNITKEGVYQLSGTMNGAVTVSTDDTAKVQLVLDGVSITAETGAAIYVEKADKVFITLADGTENTLTSLAFDADGSIDGAIFSKDDLTLNGTGSLTVVSANHGIVGKDDLKITGGTYTITAEGRGLDANDSVRVADGSITILSGKDAIRAKSEDEGKGYVLIAGGTFDLTVNGGAANGEAHTDDMMMRGFGRGGWGQYNSTATEEDTASSAKGIKAKQRLIILDGAIAVNSADDALHTDGDLTVNGGSIILQSGDDGMHADNALTVNGGAIVISGPTNGGNGALDYNGTAAINGGTLIAASASGMAETFGGSSTQVSFMVNLTGSAGTITLTDGSGATLLAGDVEKNYQCVVISSPDLQVGETYTVSNASASAQVNVTAVSGGGSGNWGMGGGHGGWNRQQQMPGGQQQMPDNMPQMPGGQMPGGNPDWGSPGGGRRK